MVYPESMANGEHAVYDDSQTLYLRNGERSGKRRRNPPGGPHERPTRSQCCPGCSWAALIVKDVRSRFSRRVLSLSCALPHGESSIVGDSTSGPFNGARDESGRYRGRTKISVINTVIHDAARGGLFIHELVEESLIVCQIVILCSELSGSRLGISEPTHRRRHICICILPPFIHPSVYMSIERVFGHP